MSDNRIYIFLSLVFAWLVAAQPLSATEEKQWPPAPDTQWRLHGNDVGEQRYSPLRQIDPTNIDKLGLAWFFDMYTRRGVEATPLMVDGTLYVSGSWSMHWMRNQAHCAGFSIPRLTVPFSPRAAVTRSTAVSPTPTAKYLSAPMTAAWSH